MSSLHEKALSCLSLKGLRDRNIPKSHGKIESFSISSPTDAMWNWCVKRKNLLFIPARTTFRQIFNILGNQIKSKQDSLDLWKYGQIFKLKYTELFMVSLMVSLFLQHTAPNGKAHLEGGTITWPPRGSRCGWARSWPWPVRNRPTSVRRSR